MNIIDEQSFSDAQESNNHKSISNFSNFKQHMYNDCFFFLCVRIAFELELTGLN